MGEVLRKEISGFRSGEYGVFLYEDLRGPGAPYAYAAACDPVTEDGYPDYDAAGLADHKKVSFWFKLPEDDVLTMKDVKVLTKAAQGLFNEEEWPERITEIMSVPPPFPLEEPAPERIALVVGNQSLLSDFSDEEKDMLIAKGDEFGNLVANFKPRVLQEAVARFGSVPRLEEIPAGYRSIIRDISREAPWEKGVNDAAGIIPISAELITRTLRLLAVESGTLNRSVLSTLAVFTKDSERETLSNKVAEVALGESLEKEPFANLVFKKFSDGRNKDLSDARCDLFLYRELLLSLADEAESRITSSNVLTLRVLACLEKYRAVVQKYGGSAAVKAVVHKVFCGETSWSLDLYALLGENVKRFVSEKLDWDTLFDFAMITTESRTWIIANGFGDRMRQIAEPIEWVIERYILYTLIVP